MGTQRYSLVTFSNVPSLYLDCNLTSDLVKSPLPPFSIKVKSEIIYQ